jgi:hypothetical protein
MSNESAPTEPSPSPFDDEPTVEVAASGAAATKPRLSIMHLMIWTAMSGVMMGFYNLTESLQTDRPSKSITEWINSPINLALRTVASMAGGANLCGVLLLIDRRRRGIRFPVEPGEWLLVWQGIGTIIGLTMYLALTTTRILVDEGYVWSTIYQLVSSMIVIAEYMFPWLLCKDNRDWRRFFFTATVLSFLSMFMMLANIALPVVLIPFNPMGPIRWVAVGVGMLMFACAIGGDIRRRTSRSWVHWVGVVTLSLQFLGSQGWYIYWMISRPELF